MDVLIRELLIVCKLMGEDSDGTLELEEWSAGGR